MFCSPLLSSPSGAQRIDDDDFCPIKKNLAQHQCRKKNHATNIDVSLDITRQWKWSKLVFSYVKQLNLMLSWIEALRKFHLFTDLLKQAGLIWADRLSVSLGQERMQFAKFSRRIVMLMWLKEKKGKFYIITWHETNDNYFFRERSFSVQIIEREVFCELEFTNFCV